MLERLVLCDDLIVQVGEHARACLPLEACGLIAGRGECAAAFLPVANELKSPVAFRMEPQEQLNAFLWIEAHSFDLLAVFHSHPSGPETPSPTDIAEFYYPGTASLIWTPSSLRAFIFDRGSFSEIPIVINDMSNE
jgi:proteasome lid subunit RPN8/RPN11